MKFEVTNLDELDQFIKDNNVNVEKSNLTIVFEHLRNGTHRIDDRELALSNGAMIFLVCNKENNGITMKNFIVKLREIK
jgi:hypothetical protein